MKKKVKKEVPVKKNKEEVEKNVVEELNEDQDEVEEKNQATAPEVKDEAQPDSEMGKAISFYNFQVVKTENLVRHYDRHIFGPSAVRMAHINRVHKQAILSNLARYDTGEVVYKFQRRITAMTWHPKRAYLGAVACKGGDVVLIRRVENDVDQRVFDVNQIIEGSGPGGAIFSVKFNEEDSNLLYTASLDGKVLRYDLNNLGKDTFVFYDFENWSLWHTAMDVSTSGGVLMAGDNKGYARLFDIRTGNPGGVFRLHKSKIHHCEFNPTVPHLIATAALDPVHGVCIWDLRNLGTEKPNALRSFSDITAGNVATFNPSGTRLVVNNQKDVINAYEGPLWNEYLTIKHPHRQFQHLTGIEASWHPLHDLIVIGRYPVDPMHTKRPSPRPIDIFDGTTGEHVRSIFHPMNGIISLNLFNPNGEVLTSAMGCSLILWQASHHLEMLGGGEKRKRGTGSGKLSAAMQNAIRGHQGRRRKDDDEDDGNSDEEDDIEKIKKKHKTAAANKKSAVKGKKSKQQSDARDSQKRSGRRR